MKEQIRILRLNQLSNTPLSDELTLLDNMINELKEKNICNEESNDN